MKNIIRILLFITLVISIAWMINSNFDYEPIIVVISAIIGLIATEVFSKRNKAKVKGKKNKVLQKSDDNLSNELDVEGDENQIIQM